MPERLVDVERQGAESLHTFPVTLSPPADEEAFKQKALEAAGHAKLVPNEELESSNAKMHVSRGGQLTPYRIAWCAGGNQGGSGPGRSRARLFALGAGGAAGGPRRRLLAPRAVSALLRTRLRAVGAGGLSGRQGGRVLVSDARL